MKSVTLLLHSRSQHLRHATQKHLAEQVTTTGDDASANQSQDAKTNVLTSDSDTSKIDSGASSEPTKSDGGAPSDTTSNPSDILPSVAVVDSQKPAASAVQLSCVVPSVMTLGWEENYAREVYATFDLPADAESPYFRIDKSEMLTNESLRNAMSGKTYSGEFMLDGVSTGVKHIQTQEVQFDKGDVKISGGGHHVFRLPKNGACPSGAGNDCVRFTVTGKLVYNT